MDEVEFDDFYTTSYARVVGQVYAMIGSRDEAEECVQEAFVRAWAHRRSLDRAGHHGHGGEVRGTGGECSSQFRGARSP